MGEKEAIAVIGGADGPTAIFVAAKIGVVDILVAVLLVAAVIGFGFWLWKKRKK